MKNIDIKAFRKSNNLTQTELGDYLGCTKAFISAIEKGNRPIPHEMYSKMINNPYQWDISPLASGQELLSQVEREHYDPMMEQVIGFYKRTSSPSENMTLIGYLLQKIEDKDALIQDLYKQIGMLEAKLDLARKGEIASPVAGSSDASAV